MQDISTPSTSSDGRDLRNEAHPMSQALPYVKIAAVHALTPLLPATPVQASCSTLPPDYVCAPAAPRTCVVAPQQVRESGRGYAPGAAHNLKLLLLRAAAVDRLAQHLRDKGLPQVLAVFSATVQPDAAGARL